MSVVGSGFSVPVLRMKRILILSHYFPPHSSVASLRVYAFAKYLLKQGHEVRVITTRKYFFDGLQINHMPDLDCKIVVVDYLPFLPEHSGNAPVGNASTMAGAMGHTKAWVSTLRSLARFIRRLLGSFMDVHLLAEGALHKRARAIYNAWPYDIVLSSYSPSITHMAAAKLKRKLPIFWVADYRDLWSQNHDSRAKFPVSLYERHLERSCVGRADLITTVSDDLKEKLLQLFPNQTVQVVENGYDIEQDRLSEVHEKTIGATITLSYTGTLYAKQDVSRLVEAIELLHRDHGVAADQVILNIYGDNAGYAARYQDKSFVRFYPKTTRSEILRIQSDSTFLLFLEWEDPDQKGILTGKLFEYLFSGTPIVATGSYKSQASEIIENSGCGRYFADANTLAEYLYENLKAGSITLRPDNDYRSTFISERLVGRLADAMSARLSD